MTWTSRAKPFAFVLAVLAGAGAVEAAEPKKGRLVADVRGQIAAQFTGERSQRVTEVRVRVGDRVKKGDLLARLDTDQLEADKLIIQRSLDEAKAALEVANAAVARADLDLRRRAGLKGSPSYNRALFEDAEIALQAAEGQRLNAERTVKRREAEIERVDLEIKLADIKAPYDALVLAIITSVGASVTQQSPDLFTLQDLSQIEISVPLPDSQIAALTIGQNVDYAIAGGARKTAVLRTILPSGGAGEDVFAARLQPNPTDLPIAFRDGQAVEVFFAP